MISPPVFGPRLSSRYFDRPLPFEKGKEELFTKQERGRLVRGPQENVFSRRKQRKRRRFLWRGESILRYLCFLLLKSSPVEKNNGGELSSVVVRLQFRSNNRTCAGLVALSSSAVSSVTAAASPPLSVLPFNDTS